ncbi:hypothetical protein IT411_00435 [Candidatus Peregrinibacteria bacterium]|nr:hypothetical protein [Candidatus Peregrinibacteria bacterium]
MERTELVENLRKMVTVNLETPEELLSSERFLIIYDNDTPLSKELSAAYRELLPAGRAFDYYSKTQAEVLAEVERCQAGDLVILIESTSFRMSNFRWRLELFNRGLKVIEHAHLSNNWPDETATYCDTLRFDDEYLKKTSEALKVLLEKAEKVRVVSTNGSELVYEAPFEAIKKNIGDFGQMKNKGCGFPIGEIFTEPAEIDKANGEVEIFAFADVIHRVVFPEKNIHLKLEKGQVTLMEDKTELEKSEWGKSLLQVFEMLAAENEDGLVWARELGFGLNRGISKIKHLHDISDYERVCGVNMSLVLKHYIYREKVSKVKAQRYHVDIFPDVSEVWIDQEKVFGQGQWLV